MSGRGRTGNGGTSGAGCGRGLPRTGSDNASGGTRTCACGYRAEASHPPGGAHEAGDAGPRAGPAADHGIDVAATGPEQDEGGERIGWGGLSRLSGRGRHRCGGIKPAVQHGIHHRRRPQDPLHQPPSQAGSCTRARAKTGTPTLLPLLRRQPPHGNLPVEQGPDWKEGSHRTRSHQGKRRGISSRPAIAIQHKPNSHPHSTQDPNSSIPNKSVPNKSVPNKSIPNNSNPNGDTQPDSLSLRQLVHTRLKHCSCGPPGLATANLRCQRPYSPAVNCPNHAQQTQANAERKDRTARPGFERPHSIQYLCSVNDTRSSANRQGI